MGYPRFIILSILFITFCIGIWAGIFVFRGGHWRETPASSTPTPSATNSTPDASVTPTITPKETAAQSALERCITAEQKKIGDAGYEKGSLLASFQSPTTFAQAREVVESNGLHYQTRENIETDFKTNRWLGITVPKGQEFKWICVLKESPKVKTVILNRLFDLHE